MALPAKNLKNSLFCARQRTYYFYKRIFAIILFKKMNFKPKSIVCLAALVALCSQSLSQINNKTRDELLGQINTITTAVPFLLIAPDARAGGMGDYGVATSPDPASTHWNPS